jgi:hypothetical protein
MAIKSALLNRRVWTPAQLPEELWLDASDSSTFTLNSDKVAEWRDKSGNNRHFGQSTDTFRPLLRTEGNLFSVRFDGVNDRLTTSFFPANSLAIVFRKTNTAVAGLITTNTQSTGLHLIVGVTPTGNIRLQSSNTNTDAFSFTNNVNNLRLVIGNKNNNIIRVEGQTISSDRTVSNLVTATTAVLGNIFFSSANRFFKGEICELLAFSQVLTSTEFELLEGYFAFKWGLQSTLPSEHPYKNTCPFI